MAKSIGSLFVNIVAKTGQLEKGLRRASQRVERFANQAAQYAKRAGVGLLALGAYAVKVAADFETINTQLATMLGSLSAAKSLMKEINQFSTRTPYEPGELAGGAAKLLAFGVSRGDVMGRLQLLGDIAAGSGARLQDLVSVFGKMRSSGVVALGDLNQLGDRGIPIFETLKDQLGKSGGQLRKFVSTGQLQFEDVTTAMESMTSETGLFHGAMEKLSATLAGKFLTMMGNIKLLAASIGEQLLPVVSMVADQMNRFLTTATTAGKAFDASGIMQFFLKIGDYIQQTMLIIKAGLLSARALLAETVQTVVSLIPGGANLIDHAKVGEYIGQAKLAGMRAKNATPFSSQWKAAQIAKPTEYARTRGMRPGTVTGGRELTPLGVPPAPAPVRAAASSQSYAGLYERGSASTYTRQLGRKSPEKELNETTKKHLKEAKIQTTLFKDIATKLDESIGKAVSIPSG